MFWPLVDVSPEHETVPTDKPIRDRKNAYFFIRNPPLRSGLPQHGSTELAYDGDEEMNMIKLYGHPFSLNARKVHWALEELGLSYEYQVVHLPKGEHKKAEFLALNPAGRIPVLTDGDTKVSESNAIVLYLAEEYGRGKLVPDDKKARGLLLQWMFWQVSDGSTTLSRPWYLRIVAPMLTQQPSDETAIAQAVANAAAPLRFLDAALASSTYLAGSDFSAADICVGEAVLLAQTGGVDIGAYANVSRWASLVSSRPACVKTRP